VGELIAEAQKEGPSPLRREPIGSESLQSDRGLGTA